MMEAKPRIEAKAVKVARDAPFRREEGDHVRMQEGLGAVGPEEAETNLSGEALDATLAYQRLVTPLSFGAIQIRPALLAEVYDANIGNTLRAEMI